MVASGIHQNFNNAASNEFAVLIQEGSQRKRGDNSVKLTCNGDPANTHEPMKHLSPERAMANRHGVHCESTSSEV